LEAVLDLPLFDGDVESHERADAARNRRRILAAAGDLVAQRGIEHVSMDDVARAAAVGTGTLYRRFGGRAGLALALLDEQTREFQDAFIGGPPPLGPGAPAGDRLHAFGAGYLALLERHADVLAVAEPSRQGGQGPHQAYAAHLSILLRELAPQVDPEFTSQALLAMLAPGHYVHVTRNLGWTPERVLEGWCRLIDALAPTASR
jgi:AcrR family transcriptional regulator